MEVVGCCGAKLGRTGEKKKEGGGWTVDGLSRLGFGRVIMLDFMDVMNNPKNCSKQ
jgi:hypothetical protein